MRKAWLMHQSAVSNIANEGQVVLLRMACLFYCPLHIFQRTFGGRDNKQHLGSLLLDHCYIINDGLVAGLQMQSLRT